MLMVRLNNLIVLKVNILDKFAARLNSFKIGYRDYWPGKNDINTFDLLTRASKAGINAADLNFPDHFENIKLQELKETLKQLNIHLNGLAMRYYSEEKFKLGAFTNPEKEIRKKAIEETKKGIDVLSELNGDLLTLWMGQDGFDYSFQADYCQLWDWTIDALREITEYNPKIKIALEYKPNEPRSFSLMPDVSTTLMAIKEVGNKNMGVVLDFAHVLYADEMPAYSANLIGRYSEILGVHLNDGYGKWDNGLMVGSVHPIQIIELLVELKKLNYKRAIYFDTFPDHSGLDPITESSTNIKTFKKLNIIADKLINNSDLNNAISNQNASQSFNIIQDYLFK